MLPEALRARITSARQLAPRPAQLPPLTTADPRLDRLLEGGLERGAVLEMVGRRSSGRFSLLLTALAAATASGHAAVLIDLGDSLDPRMAEHAGVVLERLLWLRPRRLKEALAGAEMVIASGFPLVVLDLGAPPVPGGRGVEAGWLRLARAAREREVALLVSAPYRVSGTTAATVVEPETTRALWSDRGTRHGNAPRRLLGLRATWAVRKRRGHAPGDRESWTLTAAIAAAAVRPRGDSRSSPPRSSVSQSSAPQSHDRHGRPAARPAPHRWRKAG